MSLRLASQGKTDSKKFGRKPISETDLRGKQFFHNRHKGPKKAQVSPEDINLTQTKL
jgi:hypothetical protein